MPGAERSDLWEARFREQMRVRRERLGLSQGELARRIREHGPAFHQQTVARIEAGERPIRLDEAALIIRELESDLPDMLRPLNPTREEMYRRLDALEQEYQATHEQLTRYEVARIRVDEWLRRVTGEEDLEAVAGEVAGVSPERLVQQWRGLWDEDKPSEVR